MFAHRTADGGRGKRAYELIFINVSGRRIGRSMRLEEVQSREPTPFLKVLLWGRGEEEEDRRSERSLLFLFPSFSAFSCASVSLFSCLPFVVCLLFEVGQSWLIPRVLAKGIQGEQIRPSRY